MTEVTNGQIDPAHYGPTGDIARHIASYCNGSARVHVYTAAFQALAAARAEAEALAEEVAAEKARHRETLDVLQTSYNSEAAARVQIQYLRDTLEGLLEHSEPIGVIGDHFAAEARAELAKEHTA